jgi:putative transposase
LEPVVENGVTKFMRKLNVGYAKYFNTKYERKGALFEGRYKSLIVDNEAYFVHLPYYIHLNPLDLIGSGWRQRKINDHQKAENFLEQYRWSSYLDYIGKKNFPSVTQRETLNEFFGGPEQYKKETVKWLKEINLKEIDKIILE